jgi:hypothetical protein
MHNENHDVVKEHIFVEAGAGFFAPRLIPGSIYRPTIFLA